MPGKPKEPDGRVCRPARGDSRVCGDRSLKREWGSKGPPCSRVRIRTCEFRGTEMAIRFENWLAKNPGGFTLESRLRVNEQGQFVSKKGLAADPSLKTKSPFSVSKRYLNEWIAFLRRCGGFEVC